MTRRSTHPSSLRYAIAILAGLASITSVLGFRAPQPRSFSVKVLASYDFVATVVPQELSEVKGEVPADLLSAVGSFKAESGKDWRFHVDRRSGGIALAEGKGPAWIGAGGAFARSQMFGGKADAETLTALEGRARDLMTRYPSLFRVPLSQLVLDERASVNLGESGQFWSVAFRQVVDGVPVEGARVVFRVAHGNLVQFGVDRTIPFPAGQKTPASLVGSSGARAALSLYLGGVGGDEWLGKTEGELAWHPRGVDASGPYTGPVGQGWQAVLAYRFVVEKSGEVGSWEALVDALSGEVLQFKDAVDYAALVKAGVYIKTNCTDPLNCVPGSLAESPATLAFTNLNFVGAVCPVSGCFTNSAGAYEYPPMATAASTSLDGKYIRIVDECGAVSGAAAAPNSIDLGTSDHNPPLNTNTDCFPATRETPPNSGPTSGGAGDTHAARNCFYHLNLMNQKARVYLPGNDWLKGKDGTQGAVNTHTNLPPACNAFWEPNTGQLVFMKTTPSPPCNNTGEIPDIFLHEFGHGLDTNDATQAGPNGGSREAMGDTFALLQGQDSCLGEGVLLPTGSFWDNRAGYGVGSALCSGFRDLDYTRLCTHTTAAGCSAPTDPDAPNGARSGINPPSNPANPDAGTPARWNHLLRTGAPAGVADGKSGAYNCGTPISAPGPTDCVGPLGYECHCESQVASQANWDLARTLIATQFGGSIYRAPPGPTEVSGWQYMDRLWYLTRDLATSAYAATGPAPGGTTNGCSVTSWFSTYRFIDDDNGDLTDGTPHAGPLFTAFDRHAIACGSAADASNQSTPCSFRPAAPTLSTCAPNRTPVQLSWTPSPGTDRYRLLRNTLGCGSGFTPVGEIEGFRTYYEDHDVAPGVTYYYSIQPLTSDDSCYGHVSNCVAVTPSSCTAAVAPPPANVAMSAPANNQLLVSWNAAPGAGSYRVSRKNGNCASPGEFVPIATVTAPATSYLDTVVGGQQTYAYRIESSDSTCGSCPSAPSACASETATGPCVVAPEFDGLQSAAPLGAQFCAIALNWQAAESPCNSAVTYSVYRSTDPGFVPGPSNLLVSGLTGASFTDHAVVTGTHYYYVVRATDSFGNTDPNTVRRDEYAVRFGAPPYQDDAGDTGMVKFANSNSYPAGTWTVRANDAPVNTTRVYATTASGNYTDRSCMALESPTIWMALSSNPTLTFNSKYDIETGWDGGYVEVATEAGGYTNWTKLTTVNYPGVMASTQTHPACGGAGFNDGEMVFTGASGGYLPFSASLGDYQNQKIRIRFLFSSDDSTNMTGWFIDDIAITGALLPGSCIGEVSGKHSAHPLFVLKRLDGDLKLVFEDLGAAASSYNVYEGSLGIWYSHTGSLCHDVTSVPGPPGERTLEPYATSSLTVYLLVSASNSQAEGALGANSGGTLTPPGSPQSCGPTP